MVVLNNELSNTLTDSVLAAPSFDPALAAAATGIARID